MKLRFPAALASALISFALNAQTPVNTAYAITSEQIGTQQWTEVKQIDLSTGNVSGSVFESSKGQYNVFDGRSGKQLTLKANDSTAENKRPFGGLSAACAYDSKSNRLYFAPIFINQLRYIDLGAKVPSVYIFQNETLSNARDPDVEANQMTRMVIAGDGNGYALNNDGSHLVRFTTGKMPVVADLGALTDAPGNDSVSISDPNTSWGGDMVADAGGNLYLVTSHNLVFKINIQTHVATFIAKIKGVSEGYTTNGTVVDGEGKLILSSASSITGYYKVDPARWEATIIPSDANVYNTSDLANENLLFRTQLATVKEDMPENVSVYPNPVKTNAFKVTFTNKNSGDYNVQLVDIAGRMVSDKMVSIYSSGQVAEVKIDPAMTKGLYFVKVLSQENKEIYSRKIIVE
ncbi:MAG: T9SS type A sorting domain-containing protein [Chitinophagaceae bacterium]|nr:T9SS type A sorting domain-containing protein [Chitinophagaceae bacterium]